LRVDWKNFFQLGVEIKNHWPSYSTNNPDEKDFNSDVMLSQAEILSSLKGKA